MLYAYIDITFFCTGCFMSMNQIYVTICYETSLAGYVIFSHRI